MKNSQYITLPGLEDITIKKRYNTLYATVSLYSMQYEKTNAISLSDKLKRLNHAGFTQFDVNVSTGYYDSVDDVELEFQKKI